MKLCQSKKPVGATGAGEVRTVRKYPDMSDLPEEDLSPNWVEREKKVSADTRPGIVASTPSKALRRSKK